MKTKIIRILKPSTVKTIKENLNRFFRNMTKDNKFIFIYTTLILDNGKSSVRLGPKVIVNTEDIGNIRGYIDLVCDSYNNLEHSNACRLVIAYHPVGEEAYNKYVREVMLNTNGDVNFEVVLS